MDTLDYSTSYNPVLDAADDHNIAAGVGSWFQNKIDALPSNPADFFVASGLSAVNQFYNSGASIANWFGADVEQRDTEEWIRNYDDNLGEYYADNKNGIDTAGFLLGSIVPGTVGIKFLNVGQSALRAASAGKFGSHFSTVTGIVAPSRINAINATIAEIKTSQTFFSALNTNALKAVASTAWQGALEGIAAETFIQASLNASPILDQQDSWDIMKNVALGGIFGGALSGVIGGAKTYYTFKNAVKDESIRRLDFIGADIPHPSATPAEKIILAVEDRDLRTSTNFTENPIDQQLYLRKREKVNNFVRENIHAMTLRDPKLANAVADSLHNLPHTTVTDNLAFAKTIAKPTEPLEANLNTVVKYVDLDTGRVLPDLNGRFITSADSGKRLAWQPAKFFDPSPANYSELPDRYAAVRLRSEIPNKISQYDFPLLEKLLDTSDASLLEKIKIDQFGKSTSLATLEELRTFIIDRKKEFVLQLAKTKHTPNQIAQLANVSERWIEKADISLPEQLIYFGHLDRLDQLNKARVERGLNVIDQSIWEVPRYAKVEYNIPEENLINWNLEAATVAKQNEKIYQDVANNVFAKYAPEKIAENVIELQEKTLQKAHSAHVGPGAFSFENGNYSSLESHVAYIGQAVTAPLKQEFRAATRDALTSSLLRLKNNQAAAVEFSVINETIAGSADTYYLKNNILRSKSASGGEIIIKYPETLEVLNAHAGLLKDRNLLLFDAQAARGQVRNIDVDRIYAIKPNPKEYRYVAFVKDRQGKKSMLFASSDNELAQLVAKVPPEFKVYTKKQSEDFYKVAKEFDFQDSLHESFLDSTLQSKGVYSRFYPQTDPDKIVNDILNFHLKQADFSAIELVKTKYAKEFAYLENLADSTSTFSASKIADNFKNDSNPYVEYLKLALDIPKTSDVKIFREANKFVDNLAGKAIKRWKEVKASTKLTPEFLDSINADLQAAGYNGYYDAQMQLLANSSLPKGELSKLVGRTQALLSKFTLGLDPLNALNNIIGSNVLRTPELKAALREHQALVVPGTGDKIGSVSKLVASATSDFFNDRKTGSSLRQFYKDIGVIKDTDSQFLAILDDFTINGTETLAVAQSKVADLISKGEKLSGNYHAEEFNRFVSARSAHLLGEKLNLNHEELRTLISTFVNRVEGNILASQRPSIFQGPIGKAVGLFQSYQFNLLQQLFRHVGEGSGKDALMLLGLQSSLYGMQGMPAFDLVNQHLIGTASGNIEHRDIYDSTVDVAGKEAAEFMLYGIPSWVLGTNLYTRGDINPRHPTILPFNIVDIPVVAMTGKLFSSMKEGLTKVANGGNAWESALNALEHNGVNRPLAGLAAVLQGHSTTQNGSIAYENDLFSWATATRLAGGKPMDEAILRDALYRKKAYEAFDRQKLLQFRETAKTHVNSGTSPGENQIERLAKLYAESGGNQQQFSKYLLELYRTAPQTEIDKLSQDIKSPLSQKLQLWMDE